MHAALVLAQVWITVAAHLLVVGQPEEELHGLALLLAGATPALRVAGAALHGGLPALAVAHEVQVDVVAVGAAEALAAVLAGRAAVGQAISLVLLVQRAAALLREQACGRDTYHHLLSRPVACNCEQLCRETIIAC